MAVVAGAWIATCVVVPRMPHVGSSLPKSIEHVVDATMSKIGASVFYFHPMMTVMVTMMN